MDAARFADLAHALAWQLGQLRQEEWTAQLDERGGTYAVLVTGIARLSISWSARQRKLTVSGHYPEGTGGEAFQARVDPQRGLLTIAKDINRRILNAGYLGVLAHAVERKATMDATEAERASWLAKAAALFGIKPPASTDDIGRGIKPQLDLGQFVKGQGHVESYWDGARLNIELSGIPAQVALDMLKVLAESEGVRASCCFRYGPAHHPGLEVAGCLHPDHPEHERGEQGSRTAVYNFLTRSRGLGKYEVAEAMEEARASHYQVSEIYDDGRLVAVVSWDTEGLGEYTVQVPREKS